MSGPSSSLSKDDGGEQVSSHRRASACLPHGDGIEIAFSDLPVKLSPVSPHPDLQGAPPPQQQLSGLWKNSSISAVCSCLCHNREAQGPEDSTQLGRDRLKCAGCRWGGETAAKPCWGHPSRGQPCLGTYGVRGMLRTQLLWGWGRE